MKQFKPVLISLAVLVVVAALAFAVIKLFPETKNKPNTPVNNNVESSLSKIIDRSSKDVASVEITADTGESFAIDYGQNSIGMQTAIMRNADPLLAYNESQMTTLSGVIGFLTVLEEIGTGEDWAFGFDKPQRTIRVNFKDGEQVTLLIGSETPLGTGVYIRRTDRDTVYTIGESTTSILMMTKSDYRNIDLFGTVSSVDLLTEVTVSPPGKADITVIRKQDAGKVPQNQVEAALHTDYKLTSPVNRDANPDTINSTLLEKVIAIKAESLAEDYPKDLSKYGLDKPVKLKFKTSEGLSVSLLIGDKAPNGGRYLMPEGVPTVIVTESDIDLTSLSHTDIIMKLIWFYSSEDIDTITYSLPGGTSHTMKLEVKDSKLIGTYDGKTMENKNAANLFQRTVRFTIAGEFASGMQKGERVIKVQMKLKSGAITTLELFYVNERQYAASVDGKAPEYVVAVSEVRELLESFEILLRGEDIPNMF